MTFKKGYAPHNKIPKETIDKIKRLYIVGNSLEKISLDTKVSVSDIYKKVRDIKNKTDIKKLREFKKRLGLLSAYEKGYITGLFDGEGSIIIQRQNINKHNNIYYLANLNLSNQELGLLRFVKTRLKNPSKMYSYRGKMKQNIYSFGIYGKGIITEFCKFLLENSQSGKTKRKAKIMIKFCKTKDKKEQKKLYLKIKNNYKR